MVKFEDYIMPAASMGELNPMPDIKNISYIHAGYEMTDKIREDEKTYIGKGMIPTMLPYLIQDGYNRDKKTRAFKAAVVENDRIKAVFFPEMGGRFWSMYDKKKEKELLYVNPVFQPGNLGLRNAWFSGGVEFNVGIKGHNPLTCSPLWCSVDKTEKGDVLRMYEYERIRGVVYSISVYLPDDSDVLYIKCRIENKSKDKKHMYWWSNIAVPETKGTRVIVPCEESFLCFYNEDHYVLDKADIPVNDGLDVTYPCRIPSSRDFFYKIPEDNKKWIATANEDGFGLLQCSTRELIGRKLFVWGMGQGGRHWNEWLSEEGSAYIEIQAGLAHTQLEHIPMEPCDTWEWVEAYTALDRDKDVMHGDYTEAQKDIDNYISEKIGDTEKMYFPDDSEVISSQIIYKGSGWGYAEELIRGKKISDTLIFEDTYDEETSQWINLIKNGEFIAPDVSKPPVSYVSGQQWLDKLKGAKDINWYNLLHQGVIRYAMGDVDKAKIDFENSLDMCPNPWALRNLSMIYRNELGDKKKGLEYILKAYDMLKGNHSLLKEVAMQLTSEGYNEEWLEIYDTLSENLKNSGRLKLYKAISLINLKRYEDATKIINKDFVMSDIKEGELSVSYYWFELYRRIYAKEMGIEYSKDNKELIKNADEKYPLPKELDYRMHD